MGNKTRLKIGEFSRLMQVTVKTLRHYEQKELLIPNEVDEWTGYRYYSVGQMQKLNLIRNLQRLGFTLEEIRDLYDEESHDPSVEQLSEKIEETEKQLHLLMTRRNRLLCYSAIGPEMQRLGCKCPPPGYCFTIEHNKEYTPADIDIEYCEQVEEMGTDSSIIQFKKLPAVPKVLCMKHYGPYDCFYESFTEAYTYMEEQGYKVAGDPRYCYIDGIWNQEDPEKWLSIIQIPIE